MLQVADTLGGIRRQCLVLMAIATGQSDRAIGPLTRHDPHGSAALGARHRYAVIPGACSLSLHADPYIEPRDRSRVRPTGIGTNSLTVLWVVRKCTRSPVACNALSNAASNAACGRQRTYFPTTMGLPTRRW